MTDELTDRIRHEFLSQAEAVRPTGGLADRAMSRARQLRRRRVITTVVPLALVAAVAVPSTLVSRVTGPSDGGTVAAPSSTASATAAPTTARDEPRAPWVAGEILSVDGRRIRLPDGWAVLSIATAGGTTVLDVSELDRRFAVRVTADGKLTTLKKLRPPFALSQDGKFLAGKGPIATGPDTAPQPIPDLLLLEVASNRVLDRLTVRSNWEPRWFLGPGSGEVLVTQFEGPPKVWRTASGALAALDLPGTGDRTPLAVDAGGDEFITRDTAGRLRAERRGAAGPEWSVKNPADRAAFSPDGRRIAVSGQDRITILDAADGQRVARSGVLGGQGPWEVTWEDGGTVVATDPAVVQGHGALRCTASGGGCAQLTLIGTGASPDAPVVVAREPG